MKIQVAPSMTIAELQLAFRSLFPSLSLSFFTKPLGIFRFSPVKYLITERNMPLERLEQAPHDAELNIYAEMTSGELEELFEREFGLHVQVWRKDGNPWTETTCTGDLSLREHNADAAESRSFIRQLLYPAEYPDARTEWYLG